jgi:molybdenum cofactor cytidylyltransferase
MKNGLAAIILAAGFSQRMQRFKPLLPLGGGTVADHVIQTYLENGVNVVLVVGHRHNDLIDGLKIKNIRIVENPDYAKGMFTSIKTGVRCLGEDYRATFIAPVDIPLVKSATIRDLLSAAEQQPGQIIYPTFKGTRGHPTLIPYGIFPAVLESPEGGNLKSLLQSSENIAIQIEVPDRNILLDIDNPADYEELLRRFQQDKAVHTQ